MKASSHSYEFDSQEVLDICMWYTDVRKARVDREREEMIERLITKPKKWWQFWRTKHTRESAIEYLKNNGDTFCSLWQEPETRGSHWHNICNDLLWTLSNDQADLVMKSETKITPHDETASFIGEQLFNMKHAMENQSA